MKNKGTHIAAGDAHTCVVIKGRKELKCWGYNAKGQLGRDSTQTWGDSAQQMGDYLWYRPFLGTGRTVVGVFSGANAEHTCAILDDGNLKCWGRNTEGQLGLGDGNNRGDQANPYEMGNNLPNVDLGTGKTAVSVAMGLYHTCAILNDGNVKCWVQRKKICDLYQPPMLTKSFTTSFNLCSDTHA